jgi:putative addiction module component (TIGR02574 family)
MAITNLAMAEEALSLAHAERADLANLLVQSLEGDSRTDEAIKADLTRRLEDLESGKDPGLTFKQVFDNPSGEAAITATP